MKKLTSEEILEKYFSEKMLVMETEPENYDGIELQLSYPIPLRWIDEVKAETGVDIVEFAPDEVELYDVGEYSEFYVGAKTSRPEANPVHFGCLDRVDRITEPFLEDLPYYALAKLSELSIADYGVPPQYVTEELTKALNEVYFSKLDPLDPIEILGLEELLLNLKGASLIKRALLKELIISQVKNA